MSGTIALQGGGAFTANDELDARLLASVGATSALVLPTADAFEHPERLVAAAQEWAGRLSVTAEGLMVLRRGDATDPANADRVRRARAVYVVGDQPLHLRSVLKDTPLWDALLALLADGGLIVACGASAACLCDPLVDPRGGAFTIGLGLIGDLALITEAQSWSAERLHRTLDLADTAVACLDTGTALVRTPGRWETVGDVRVHGELPAPGPGA